MNPNYNKQLQDNNIKLAALDEKIANLQEQLYTADATATAETILDTKTAYINGKKVIGTMPNNQATNTTLDTFKTSQPIPEGYNPTGEVKIVLEEKPVTPTKSTQSITPTSGKVLSKVTVNPIPSKYQDVTGVTAEAGNVLTGKKYVNTQGQLVNGSMPNQGAINPTPLKAGVSYTIPAGYHNGFGIVTTESLASQTPGTAAAGTIFKDETAYVNGSPITGAFTIQTELSDQQKEIEALQAALEEKVSYEKPKKPVSKNVEIIKNVDQPITVLPDDPKTEYLSDVKITTNIPEPKTEIGKGEYYSNGKYTITPAAGNLLSKAEVLVNIPDNTSVKDITATPYTKNGTYTIEPDTYGWSMSKVKIKVDVPSTMPTVNVHAECVSLGGGDPGMGGDPGGGGGGPLPDLKVTYLSADGSYKDIQVDSEPYPAVDFQAVRGSLILASSGFSVSYLGLNPVTSDMYPDLYYIPLSGSSEIRIEAQAY